MNPLLRLSFMPYRIIDKIRNQILHIIASLVLFWIICSFLTGVITMVLPFVPHLLAFFIVFGLHPHTLAKARRPEYSWRFRWATARFIASCQMTFRESLPLEVGSSSVCRSCRTSSRTIRNADSIWLLSASRSSFTRTHKHPKAAPASSSLTTRPHCSSGRS